MEMYMTLLWRSSTVVLPVLTHLQVGHWEPSFHMWTVTPQSCAGSLLSMMFFLFFQNKPVADCSSSRSSRERSSHTRERERSPSQEKGGEGAGEGWRDNKAEYKDWEDRERSPSADTARGRERERSLSYERDRRSSSEERESGEIWTGRGRLQSLWFGYIV